VEGVLEVDVSIEGAGEFEISAVLSLLVLHFDPWGKKVDMIKIEKETYTISI
jgi:hypothetical protein